jgi:6-pyruvoyltetrahydropterin/6-carboxytetrahydropterin synthase
MKPVIRIARTATFSSAHRYADKALSEKENQDIFGSLYREKGFGHNFLLEAHFEGAVDSLTGMVVNLSEIDRWLKTVTLELDHRHLNELPAFNGRAPTPERIAQYCYRAILEQMKKDGFLSVKLAKTRVYEGETLWADYAET